MRLTRICLESAAKAASDINMKVGTSQKSQSFDISDITLMIGKYGALNASSSIRLRRKYDEFYFKSLYRRFKRTKLSEMQQFNFEEQTRLGADLYVSKFVIGHGGRVRLATSPSSWLDRLNKLPSEYQDGDNLVGIDATSCGIMPKGIDNIFELDYLEYLNLSKNINLDDLACDQLARQFRNSKTLKFIDLSENPKITVNGIEALLRIPSINVIKCKDTEASRYKFMRLFSLLAQDECQCDIQSS